jgi:hypothetical protein
MSTALPVHLTRSGVRCLWESGGTRQGRGRLVCRPDGSRPSAIYQTPREALVPVGEGYLVIRFGGGEIDVDRIDSFTVLPDKRLLANLENLHHCEEGQWSTQPPAVLEEALECCEDPVVRWAEMVKRTREEEEGEVFWIGDIPTKWIGYGRGQQLVAVSDININRFPADIPGVVMRCRRSAMDPGDAHRLISSALYAIQERRRKSRA